MSLRNLETWFREGMAWRMRNWRDWYVNRVAGPLSAYSPALARRAFCPIPGMEPYRRANLHVGRSGALGDVLLCTPALREVKRVNPYCRIRFYTNYPELVEGLPFIEEVRKHNQRPPETIELTYEHCIPPTRHIARIMGEILGVAVRDVRPACVVDPTLVERYRRLFQSLPRPHVMINRNAGPWTPNKDWPAEYWDELIDLLTKETGVIEIGTIEKQSRTSTSANYLSLLGKTRLSELVAAIAAVDVLVCPISGPVHVAAAHGVSSVVIYGGYEHPRCSRYPGNIDLFTPESCSPCWLSSPCPYDKKCLRAISPAQVLRAVQRILSHSASQPRNEVVFAR